MTVLVGTQGHTLRVSADGGALTLYYDFIGGGVQTIQSIDVSGGSPVVEDLADANRFWNQVIDYVKIIRTIHRPSEIRKSLTFKFELVKDFDLETIEFKYEIDDDVSYDAIFDKTAQTITTQPRDTYTINWVDFIGYFNAYNDFLREIDTF